MAFGDRRSLERTRALERVEKAPAGFESSRLSTVALPPGLLAKAAPRIGAVTLIYAGAYIAAVLAGEFAQHVLGDEPFRFDGGHVAAIVFVALSVAVHFVSRLSRIPATSLIQFGLVFEVVGSLGIGLGTLFGVYRGEEIWGVSWICVWIVSYPLIVPSTPKSAAIASFASAAMGPIALALWVWPGGNEPPSAEGMARMTVPNFICAGVAIFAARVIYRMGTELDRARRMGSYRLERLIGRGGFGEVWEARHAMLARPAAIKLIKAEVLGDIASAEMALRRFRREAQVTARLVSPHTVQLYDFGITDNGTFFYVMELLDGVDLQTLVERFGSLPPERVVHFLLQACHSLAEAHEGGLVHRDIKPANIFACRYGVDADFVKVLDFGLVKSLEVESSLEALETADTIEGGFAGTPAYVAPEVALRNAEVDERTDLYALGCVAYWLLTGHLVFERRTPIETIMAHAKEPPRPPSRLIEEALPEPLEPILLACLEKDIERRPRSARQLMEDLAAVPLQEPWTQERARQWWAERLPPVAEGTAPEGGVSDGSKEPSTKDIRDAGIDLPGASDETAAV